MAVIGRPRSPWVDNKTERRRAQWRRYRRVHKTTSRVGVVRSESSPTVDEPLVGGDYVRGDLLWHEQPREAITSARLGTHRAYEDPGASANWRWTV